MLRPITLIALLLCLILTACAPKDRIASLVKHGNVDALVKMAKDSALPDEERRAAALALAEIPNDEALLQLFRLRNWTCCTDLGRQALTTMDESDVTVLQDFLVERPKHGMTIDDVEDLGMVAWTLGRVGGSAVYPFLREQYTAIMSSAFKDFYDSDNWEEHYFGGVIQACGEPCYSEMLDFLLDPDNSIDPKNVYLLRTMKDERLAGLLAGTLTNPPYGQDRDGWITLINQMLPEMDPTVASALLSQLDPNLAVQLQVPPALAEQLQWNDSPANRLALALQQAQVGQAPAAQEVIAFLEDPAVVADPETLALASQLAGFVQPDTQMADWLLNFVCNPPQAVQDSIASHHIQTSDPLIERSLATALAVQLADSDLDLLLKIQKNPAENQCTGVIDGYIWDGLVSRFKENPAPLVHRLKDSQTVGQVYPLLIAIGNDSTVAALVEALNIFGDLDMAKVYLNSGNSYLEAAASEWAGKHGYTVLSFPSTGASFSTTWGAGP